ASGLTMQNGFVECFNGRRRDECLKTHLFRSHRSQMDHHVERSNL
ncbi:integrase-like protein, partial [Hoeflea halophila]